MEQEAREREKEREKTVGLTGLATNGSTSENSELSLFCDLYDVNCMGLT